jgi:teichoic acid transport system ATP-binding protein
LADSIRTLGVIQPITVKSTDEGRYIIISGERRWRAAQIAEIETLPAYIREADDTNLLDDAQLQDKAADAAGVKAESTNPAPGQNPNLLEYGTKQAEITEFYITDDRGVRTNAIIKGSEFTVHMKVAFYDHIPAPIFAVSIKNAIGVEITGTNTMIEKAFLDSAKPGDKKEITFTQKMSLQGGDYLLSLGLTGYNKDIFEVYHRLYDVLNISVVSDKNTVGYYDMDSKIIVRDC